MGGGKEETGFSQKTLVPSCQGQGVLISAEDKQASQWKKKVLFLAEKRFSGSEKKTLTPSPKKRRGGLGGGGGSTLSFFVKIFSLNRGETTPPDTERTYERKRSVSHFISTNHPHQKGQEEEKKTFLIRGGENSDLLSSAKARYSTIDKGGGGGGGESESGKSEGVILKSPAG